MGRSLASASRLLVPGFRLLVQVCRVFDAVKNMLSSDLGLWIFGVPIAGFSDPRVCSRKLRVLPLRRLLFVSVLR